MISKQSLFHFLLSFHKKQRYQQAAAFLFFLRAEDWLDKGPLPCYAV